MEWCVEDARARCRKYRICMLVLLAIGLLCFVVVGVVTFVYTGENVMSDDSRYLENYIIPAAALLIISIIPAAKPPKFSEEIITIRENDEMGTDFGRVVVGRTIAYIPANVLRSIFSATMTVRRSFVIYKDVHSAVRTKRSTTFTMTNGSKYSYSNAVLSQVAFDMICQNIKAVKRTGKSCGDCNGEHQA